MRMIIVIILSLIAAFIGGCGLYYTLGAIASYGNTYAPVIFMFSIPSLLIGIAIGFLARFIHKKGQTKSNPQPKD